MLTGEALECFKRQHGPLASIQTRTYGEVIMRLTPKLTRAAFERI